MKKIYFVFVVLSIICAIIFLLFFLYIYTLEIKIFPEGKIVFKQRVSPGDEFTLKYKHSVELSPVWEIFIIDKEYKIILIETDFLDHGAGLPYAPFGEEIFVEEEDKFKIKNMYRIMPSPIYYMVGTIYENTLFFKNKEIDFSSIVGDKLLTIEVNKNSLFNYLLGGNL